MKLLMVNGNITRTVTVRVLEIDNQSVKTTEAGTRATMQPGAWAGRQPAWLSS
jgi:hypothetical protein